MNNQRMKSWLILLFILILTNISFPRIALAQSETDIINASQPFNALLETATPSADGSIIHVVGPGETLWGIAEAYDVSIDLIRSLNNLGPNSSLIRVSQQLVIRPAFTATPTASPGISPQALEGAPLLTLTPGQELGLSTPTIQVNTTPAPNLVGGTPLVTQESPEEAGESKIAFLFLVTAGLLPILILIFYKTGRKKAA